MCKMKNDLAHTRFAGYKNDTFSDVCLQPTNANSKPFIETAKSQEGLLCWDSCRISDVADYCDYLCSSY